MTNAFALNISVQYETDGRFDNENTFNQYTPRTVFLEVKVQQTQFTDWMQFVNQSITNNNFKPVTIKISNQTINNAVLNLINWRELDGFIILEMNFRSFPLFASIKIPKIKKIEQILDWRRYGF